MIFHHTGLHLRQTGYNTEIIILYDPACFKPCVLCSRFLILPGRLDTWIAVCKEVLSNVDMTAAAAAERRVQEDPFEGPEQLLHQRGDARKVCPIHEIQLSGVR